MKMEFTTTTQINTSTQTELLVIKLFKDKKTLEPKIKKLDEKLDSAISSVISRGGFSGNLGEVTIAFPQQSSSIKRVALLGLGKKENYDIEKLRIAISKLSHPVSKFKINELCFFPNQNRPAGYTIREMVQEEITSLFLSLYSFENYKEKKNVPKLNIVNFILNRPTDRRELLAGANSGLRIAESVNLARDLGNHPGNIATPKHIAEHAERLAKENKKIKTKIFGTAEIKKEKMGGLLAVSQGSSEEPRFIIMEYQHKKTAPTIVLVGKGITFDSGGISLKPAEKMEEMKYDMSGAATVMGLIKAAAEESLPLNLVGLVAASENLISGSSLKPGDIIKTRSGKSVEVINTDAEGRLVLADALNFATQYKPNLVIDFATLTGAIVVALGDELIGMFSNNEKYSSEMKKASQKSGEGVWEMPLEKKYKKLLKSDFADLRNIAITRYGDSINAALFLENFVTYPWIHLDIAGVAWTSSEKPYRSKGATGTGIRLTLEFLKNLKK